MTPIQERAKQTLSIVPAAGQINSNGATAALFTRLTGGVTQATLEQNWHNHGIMTACNEFVGWYGGQLGSQKYLGRFDLQTYLPKIGKGYAWVKSTKDVRPKYGDICRHTAFHIGISLDFQGDLWNHVDAGQGGPRTGYDIIKRTHGTHPYDYRKLQGWIDLDLYFQAAGQAQPVPHWLLGWWQVTSQIQVYYYFDGSHRVKSVRMMPREISQPPLFPDDTGNVVIQFPDAVSIHWDGAGTVTTLQRSPGNAPAPRMQGTQNNVEPITIVRM
jgi:hypothetical protein